MNNIQYDASGGTTINDTGRTVTIPFMTDLSYYNLKNKTSHLIDYLDTLCSLGDNWINSQSKQPSTISISKAKNLLGNLPDSAVKIMYESQSHTHFFPQIVIGPIPSGGISLEFINDENSVYLNLYDDELIEMEKKSNGLYEDVSVGNVETLPETILNIIYPHGGLSANHGRRETI
jgi:hypothetical protein